MNRRGRERRARPRPEPVEARTAFALAEIVADQFRPSTRTLLLDGREAGQVDLDDPRRLTFSYMRRIADLIDACADLVIGDAFDGPHVPARLSTADFVSHVKRVLRSSGVYALNVIDVPPLDEARAHAALLRDAFANALWIAPPGVLRARAPGNVVLLASDGELPVAALRRAATAAVPRELVQAA